MVFRKVEWVDGKRPGGGVLTFSESHWQYETTTYRTAEVIELAINLKTNGWYNFWIEEKYFK